jgi:hypothetical protein
MKKALLVFISLIAAVSLALITVFFLCYGILPLKYFLMGEVLIFQNELDFSSRIFHHHYFFHTLFFRIGTPILLLIAIGKFFLWLKKYLPAYHRAKELYLSVTVLGLFYVSVTVVLYWRENSLRREGWPPGQFYHAFLWVDIVNTDNQQMLADSTGMIYLNPLCNRHEPFYHVNEQGFLSDFNFTKATADSISKTGKKKMMVVGDSFTQGRSPGGHQSTYMFLLQQMATDYVVFNFGITGTDPLQYLEVIKKFTPVIQPDLVIVAFCGANDIMEYDRPLTPYIPLIWTTNAGGLFSNPSCVLQVKTVSYLKPRKKLTTAIGKYLACPKKRTL